MSDSITAISKSSSYSAGEYLPEQDIQDGCDHPALMKSMNRELVEMKESWIQKFDQNTKVAVAIIPAGTGLNGKGSKVATSVGSFLLNKMIVNKFSMAMAVYGFLLEYDVLSKHSGRAAMFQRLANRSKEEELQLNQACQTTVAFFLPLIIETILAAQKYSIAIEQWVLKEEERKMLEDEKAREWAQQGKSKKKEKKKRKSSKPKPPVEVFETACFSFIQEAAMDAFMRSLPADFGNDHLFCILIAQVLF